MDTGISMSPSFHGGGQKDYRQRRQMITDDGHKVMTIVYPFERVQGWLKLKGISFYLVLWFPNQSKQHQVLFHHILGLMDPVFLSNQVHGNHLKETKLVN